MSWDRKRITELLLEAGDIARHVKGDMQCELKSDRSLVTRADKEIEDLFSRELESPENGRFLIGEETVGDKGEAYLNEAFKGECFVVDPVDGTAPYAHYLPVWGVSIGYMHQGVLTDGGIYLPDMGELVISDGDAVLLGRRQGEDWEWTEIEGPISPPGGRGLVSVTQAVAKRGKVLVANPVLVLGVAVVPMVGLLQGRFNAYLGSVKLWDLAGALPLLLRKGFSITVRVGDEIRSVTNVVDQSTYYLQAGDRRRWALRSDMLICHPGEQGKYRAAFTSGDP